MFRFRTPRLNIRSAFALAVIAAFHALSAAEPLNVRAVLTPKEQIRLTFQDGSGHFLLMVRREGQASGKGLFSGAQVTEYGHHDIVPDVSGDPGGYLVIRPSDGQGTAYLKWTVRAVALPGPDGKPELIDNGVWEVVSGTGSLKGLRGAGILHIKPAGPKDRLFTLEGSLVAASAAP